jgi:hypothetical protein
MRRNGSTVKKAYNLPANLIARVKRILRARTETEAVVLALREVAFMDEVGKALRSTSGKIPNFKPLR